MKKAVIRGRPPATSAVQYAELKGVDFSTDPSLISKSRSPYAPNLVSGPGGYPEKRPGWRTVKTGTGHVYGMYSGTVGGQEIYLIHRGKTISRWCPYAETPAEQLYADAPEQYSTAFPWKDKLYILTGTVFLVCEDDAGLKIHPASDNAKTPEIVFSSPPYGGGKPLQPRNLLTNKRKVGFLGDGGNETYTDAKTLYSLPEENIVEGSVKVRVRDAQTGEWADYTEVPKGIGDGKLNIYGTKNQRTPQDQSYNGPLLKGLYWYAQNNKYGVPDNGFAVDYQHGMLAFQKAPWNNQLAGVDNVEITYEKLPEEKDGVMQDGPEVINGCRFFGSYENRIFVSGNAEKPAYDWHSDADDPAYFPDTGFARAGQSPIMGYRAVGSSQAIVKAQSEGEASIFLRTATKLDGKTVFSLHPGIAGQGAVSWRAQENILDDPLILTPSGVFAITSTLVSEDRTLAARSRFIDPRLTQEAHLKDAVACEWGGMYLLSMTDGTIYALDGKQDKVYTKGTSLAGSSYGYECYHWTNIPAVCWMPDGENLFFGTADGRVCRFNTDIPGVERYNDDGAPIKAARATRVEYCGDFLRYKTMIKKGSGLLMQPYERSSVTAYVRTNKAKADVFFRAPLDDYDWTGDTLGESYEDWEGAQVVPFRRKVKKFLWIQIILENNEVNEGFGVYGIIIRHQLLGLA